MSGCCHGRLYVRHQRRRGVPRLDVLRPYACPRALISARSCEDSRSRTAGCARSVRSSSEPPSSRGRPRPRPPLRSPASSWVCLSQARSDCCETPRFSATSRTVRPSRRTSATASRRTPRGTAVGCGARTPSFLPGLTAQAFRCPSKRGHSTKSKFGGRRPYRLVCDGDEAWWVWMDEERAAATRALCGSRRGDDSRSALPTSPYSLAGRPPTASCRRASSQSRDARGSDRRDYSTRSPGKPQGGMAPRRGTPSSARGDPVVRRPNK